MSRPEDTDPTAPERELLLVDLLYGELSEEAEAKARETVESDESLAGELAGLSSLRELFAELPDQEPPSAISAQLLHAAAAEAPGPADSEERPGLLDRLARFFKPLMLHPGLAAAASLVLVAGVAGVLYVSGQWRTAEPKVESKAPEPTLDESAPAAAAEPPATTAAPAADPAPITEADSDEKAGYTDDVGAPPAKQASRSVNKGSLRSPKDVGKKKSPAKRRSVRRRPLKNDKKATDKAPLQKAYSQPPPPPAKPSPSGGSSVTKPAAEPRLEPSEAPEQKKRSDDSTKAKESEQRVPLSVTLHRQARTAARSGDCGRARALTRRIRSLDSRYHRVKVQSDPTLAPCLRGTPARKKK